MHAYALCMNGMERETMKIEKDGTRENANERENTDHRNEGITHPQKCWHHNIEK